DEFYGKIYDIPKNKKPVPVEIHHHIKHYEYRDEVLYYRTLLTQPCTRVVIPSGSDLVRRLIKNAHSGVDAGHFGTFKTYLNLADTFFWKNMLPSIKKFCNRCQVCQRNNSSTQKLQGLFMPLPVPEGRWTDVSMDFVTGIPKTISGYDMIMVIVDRFSKMAHFIPTDKSLTAERCARLFVECCLKHHGVPRRLVSDKDVRFMNRFWYTIHFLFGTSLLFSTTNHPQTDGQTERINKVLNHLIRKHCSNDMLNWDQYLPIVEFAYNSTYQDSIKDVPFRLGIGYVPDSMKKVSHWKIDDDRFSPSAEEYMRRMAITLQQTQDNIVEAQRSQEKYHNQHRRPHNYKVGDYILLHRDARGVSPTYIKIQPVFFGPYRLVKQINDNTFEVDLPSMNKKDRVMNVQWFKPYHHQQDLFRQPPRTDREILARINEMCGIGGVDHTNSTYDVIWRDCDPRHATTISASQFNTASESLRTSLLHQARCLCAHEQRT
ncbi:MAG: transposase family protein, partial [Lactococcus lactis]|nr:transposase family protein [Lactococcus lactis]